MSPDIIVAVLVFAASIIGSVTGAYATVRAANNKAKAEAEKQKAEAEERIAKLVRDNEEKDRLHAIQLAIVASRMDTLWEIYAEDAIREARTSGTVKARSPLSTTEEWYDGLSYELAQKIKDDASQLATIFNSPYDVAIELWGKYKSEILSSGISSVRVLWGTILVVSMSAVAAENKDD